MTKTRFSTLLPLTLFAVALASATACVSHNPLEATGCPCAPGWQCDATGTTCEPAPGGVDSGAGGGTGGADTKSPATGGVGGGLGTGGTTTPPVDTTYPDGCQDLLPDPAAVGAPLVASCPCTRRPGPGNSRNCPQGANQSTTFTVGPEGGTFGLSGQQKGIPYSLRLEIPAGAVQQPTTLTLTETDLSPPSSYVDYSPIYRIAPLGLTFRRVVALRLFDSNESGTIPKTLGIQQSKAGTPCSFERMPDSYINAGFLDASMTETGYFFAGFPKTPEQAMCP